MYQVFGLGTLFFEEVGSVVVAFRLLLRVETRPGEGGIQASGRGYGTVAVRHTFGPSDPRTFRRIFPRLV